MLESDTSLEDYPILLREIVRSGTWDGDRETGGKRGNSSRQGVRKRVQVARVLGKRSAEKIISRCIFHIVGFLGCSGAIVEMKKVLGKAFLPTRAVQSWLRRARTV